MTETIILASGSAGRQTILRNAGVAFEAIPADIDERAVEAPLRGAGLSPEDNAMVLAEAKALDVSARNPGRLVLGCDQVLSFGDEILHKPADMEAARRQLLKLSDATHHLNSALSLARDGDAIWRHVSVAAMTMRPLSPKFIGGYLAAAGDAALASVGAYQIEGPGIQLFDRIEGDFFTIVGLPLLPLLKELRSLGIIDG